MIIAGASRFSLDVVLRHRIMCQGGNGTVKRLSRCSTRDTVSYPLSGGRDQVNIKYREGVYFSCIA